MLCRGYAIVKQRFMRRSTKGPHWSGWVFPVSTTLEAEAHSRWRSVRRRRGIGYAISADMSSPLHAEIMWLPERAWQPESTDAEAIREWAEVP